MRWATRASWAAWWRCTQASNCLLLRRDVMQPAGGEWGCGKALGAAAEDAAGLWLGGLVCEGRGGDLAQGPVAWILRAKGMDLCGCMLGAGTVAGVQEQRNQAANRECAGTHVCGDLGMQLVAGRPGLLLLNKWKLVSSLLSFVLTVPAGFSRRSLGRRVWSVTCSCRAQRCRTPEHRMLLPAG